MNLTTNGEILQDIKNGKERPWRKKKVKSGLLSESFNRLEMRKRAERTLNCATFLKFVECRNDEYKKLIDANFCRDRLCPMCNWRRSRKLQQQIFQILHVAHQREPKMRFVFLTLTVKNVPGEKLGDTVTEMLKGFKALMELKEVDDFMHGYVRALEVTYNKGRDDFHPHIHVLLGMRSTYFSGGGYINHARWQEMWQGLLKLDYPPIVHIKPIKKRSQGEVPVEAAMEVGKYVAKDADYIHEGNEALTDKVVSTFAKALKSRRLIGFGKLFRRIHRELNLMDVESKNVDLVSGNDAVCSCPLCASNLFEQLYKWRIGINVYLGVD